MYLISKTELRNSGDNRCSYWDGTDFVSEKSDAVPLASKEALATVERLRHLHPQSSMRAVPAGDVT